MKAFSIFRPGKHTASNGSVLEFTAAQLKEAVAAYNAELHEAPIVVGHPKDNHPAYGWVKGLTFDEKSGDVMVQPDQVEAAFDEMVEAGRFKKRSASWYLPDSSANPTPGKLYLRHVGFLGAQPPAIKGLKDVAFAADEQGVVEYIDDSRWAWGSVAAIFRGLRDWLISSEDLETADRLMPNYLLTDIEAASRAATTPSDVMATPAYSEGTDMADATLQAKITTLEAEIVTLKANQKPANFAEQETAAAAREASLTARETAVAAAEQLAARAGVETRVDAIVKAGRLVPAQKKSTIDFAMGLSAKELTIDFGEGDKARKVTQRDAYLLQLEAAPKVVTYGELAAGGGAAPGDASGLTADKIADKASAIHEAAAAKGKSLSFTEAVAQATAELTAAA